VNKIGYLGRTPLGDLYCCHYSGLVAIEKHMKFIAPVLPQCPVPEAVHATLMQDEIKEARKQSIKAFNEMDKNCNTCRHFERLKSDNEKGSDSASNFVYGDCKNNGRIDLVPLKRDGFQIMVHVADYMDMPCWEGRG
jgi:hypothetical protein